MPFEGHYIMYYDDQALSLDKLAGVTLTIRPVVTTYLKWTVENYT